MCKKDLNYLYKKDWSIKSIGRRFLCMIKKIATARIRAWVLRATIWGTNHYTTVATHII